MRALWPTVVAPLLDACRPATVIELGEAGEGLADLLAEAVSGYGGTVARDFGDAAPELAIVHGKPDPQAVKEALERLEQAGGPAPYPLTLVHGVDPATGYAGVLVAVEEFLEDCREELRLVHVPGLGGTAVLVSPLRLEGEGSRQLARLLDDWQLSRPALAQLAAVEAERVRAEARVDTLSSQLASAKRGVETQAAAGHEALRERLRELADRNAELTANLARREARQATLEAGAGGNSAPTSAPTALAADLLGVSPEPQPADCRRVLVDPRTSPPGGTLPLQVVAWMTGEPGAMQRSLWSLLARADRPLALTLVVDGDTAPELREMARAFVAANPAAAIAPAPPPGDSTGWRLAIEGPVTFGHLGIAELMAAAEDEGPPRAVSASEAKEDTLDALGERLRDPLAIAYVLPGLPPGGSGGSHSIVQEARALAGIGVPARVLTESGFEAQAKQLYPESESLFGFYDSPRQLESALAEFDVVVATEAPSARLVAAQARRRQGILGAYYVQDYEPLFSPAGGPSADAALLSYRQAGELLLFAKTHWIGNVLAAAHDLPVAKVRPSLDRETFHAAGRDERSGAQARVAAMVRPRTPRRRPAETLAALRRLKEEMGGGVECLAFGCGEDDLAGLPPAPGVEHLGLLSRQEVAALMRGCDLFLDLSTYQAFGRTGLEAMACGAVPLLPTRGGVAEYAAHDRNALLVDGGDENAVIAAAAAVLGDRERMGQLRAAGIETASSYSLLDAAVSQYACFAANHPRQGERR